MGLDLPVLDYITVSRRVPEIKYCVQRDANYIRYSFFSRFYRGQSLHLKENGKLRFTVFGKGRTWGKLHLGLNICAVSEECCRKDYHSNSYN